MVGFDSANLAIAYKRLVLWFGVQLVVSPASLVLGAPADAGAASALLGILLSVASLVTVVALVYYANRTAVALGSTVGWLWGVAMLVPLVNAITLLVLSSKATRACRAHGVPVGLLGPKVAAGGEDRGAEQAASDSSAMHPR